MGKKSSITEYFDIKNAWIDPDGKFIPVGFMCHDEWAFQYLEGQFQPDELGIVDVYGIIDGYGCNYPWEYLAKEKGWIRLLNWTGRISLTKVVGYSERQKPNAAQRDTLYLWCSANGFNYEDLIKG